MTNINYSDDAVMASQYPLFDDEQLEDLDMIYEENVSDHSGITSDDSVSLYLNEMSRVPLLTREEEITLAKKMEIGRHARQTMIDADGNLENLEEFKT